MGQHEADAERKAKFAESQFVKLKERLMDVCKLMDKDGSGELDMEELNSGFETNEEFALIMSQMDIKLDDMDNVFHILDEDGSGSVTYKEFVDQLYKMKSQDSHSVLLFIKGLLKELRLKMCDEFQSLTGNVNAKVDSLLTMTGQAALPNVGATLADSVGNATKTFDSAGSASPTAFAQIQMGGTGLDMAPTPESNLQQSKAQNGALLESARFSDLGQTSSVDGSTRESTRSIEARVAAAFGDGQGGKEVIDGVITVSRIFQKELSASLRPIETSLQLQATNTSRLLSQLNSQRAGDDLVAIPRAVNAIGSAPAPPMCCRV